MQEKVFMQPAEHAQHVAVTLKSTVSRIFQQSVSHLYGNSMMPPKLLL